MSANASDKPDNSKRVEKDPTELDLKLFEDSQPSDSSTAGSSGAKTDTDLDITTDPFGRKFNEITPVVPPKAADGKLPDAFTDPFAPEFTNLPKPGEVTKPGEKGTKSGGSNDPFDPFGDWTVPSDLFPAKPGTKPGDTTPPQDTTVKPDAPKPDVPKPDAPKPDAPPEAPKPDAPKPDAPKPDVPPSVPNPDVPVKPGDQPVKPGDQPVKPNDSIQPNPVFNENNVGEAIKLAQSKNQPIYVFSSPNGQLDQAQQEAMKAHGADAVFVNVNFAHADQMMRAGLETTHYWQLANLCGAGGDVNNLYQKPGFMGRFNATDFNANDPRGSLKAAATGDLKTVFAGQVKPPAPAPDGPVKPDAPKPGPEAPKPDAPKPNVPSPDAPKPDVPKPDAPKDSTEKEPEKKEPAKLDQLKFDTNTLADAIKTARDNNLPLVVYKGADFCGNCPVVSATVDRFANELKNKPTTDAVVVKLNYETALNLRRTNPELFKLVDSIMPVNGSSFPQVSVYNPNDMSKPIRQDASGRSLNGYGGDINHLRNLVAAGKQNVGTPEAAPRADRQPDSPAKPRETRGADVPLPSGVMSENDVQAAQQAAKAKGIPMLSYLDNAKGSNENLAKAMQYLSENGLASTVKIDRQNAEGMLQRGLETSKFYALKNSMLRTPDVAQDGSSHLSAFSPNNFGQPTSCTEAAKSPEEIVSFLKKSGVDLSKGNAEAAVLKLLGGKTVPPPAPEVAKPDATPVEPEKKPEAIKPEVKPHPEVKPEVKPESSPQPEAKPEVKPEVKPEAPPKPEVKPATPPQPEVKPEVKPEAPPQPQFNPEPMVLPATPGKVEAEVKPEVKPALNLEPTLPKASDIVRAKAEKLAENPNKVKVNDADEALQVMEDAKARGVDLVVHSPTVICTAQTCTMTKLPEAVADEYSKQAVFMELPRGGVKVPDGAQYDALRAINDLYKISNEDHKTQLDLHVYSFNKDKGYQLNDESALSKDISKSVASKRKIK